MVWPTVSETIQLEAEPFAQNLTPQKLIPFPHYFISNMYYWYFPTPGKASVPCQLIHFLKMKASINS